MTEPAPKNAPRVRMDPAERRAQLLATARDVFAEKGYAASGLAEIAERAGVNKRLVYYYFPDGRSELFKAVMADVTAELVRTVQQATRAPVHTAKKVERLVEALVAFFAEEPAAFAVLFRDPYGVREPDVVLEAVVAQAELAREFATLLSTAGAPADTLLAVSSGVVAYVMRVIEMAVAGEIDCDTTVDACMTCILGVMTQVGLPPA